MANYIVNPAGEKQIINSDGSRSIAPSLRADGSQRPEIKIRPGYVRDEDREKYRLRKGQVKTAKKKKPSIYDK